MYKGKYGKSDDGKLEIKQVIDADKDGLSKSKNKGKKTAIITISVILGIVVLVAVAFFILKEIGKNRLLSGSDTSLIIPSEITNDVLDDGESITYKGQKYSYNKNVTNILFMGIDRESELSDTQTPGNAGQADSLFLMSIDTKTGETTVSAVSRDTITDVGLYAVDGSYLGTQKGQVCLAYAYGDGNKLSCERTVSVVSSIMYGLPINSFISIDYEGVRAICDMFGGISVTLVNDCKISGVEYSAGETIILQDENVMTFLRIRDANELDSNNARIQNQQAFLKSLVNTMITKTKADITTPVKMYSQLSEYMVTNIEVPEITFLTNSFLSGNSSAQVDFRTVQGTVDAGVDGKAEFTPDDTALYELILDIAYTKVN